MRAPSLRDSEVAVRTSCVGLGVALSPTSSACEHFHYTPWLLSWGDTLNHLACPLPLRRTMHFIRPPSLSARLRLCPGTASKTLHLSAISRPGALTAARNIGTDIPHSPARHPLSPTLPASTDISRSMLTRSAHDGEAFHQPKHLNRLAKAKSLYLLQHAENPVRRAVVQARRSVR